MTVIRNRKNIRRKSDTRSDVEDHLIEAIDLGEDVAEINQKVSGALEGLCTGPTTKFMRPHKKRRRTDWIKDLLP